MVLSWPKQKQIENSVIILIGLGLAVGLRVSLLPFVSDDMTDFFLPWFRYLQENGWAGLATIDSNYMPSYQYLLLLMTYLPDWLSPVVAIKLISMPFDFLLAWVMVKLVRLKYPTGDMGLFVFLLMLFVPTIFINSSFWGQVDGIYTFFLLLSLYCILTSHSRWAMVTFGIAFSFKLQALFFAPLLIVLWLKRQIHWHFFLIIPAVFSLSLVPAWLAGRPFLDLFTIYLNQAGYYRTLTKNAPNLYQWFPNELYDVLYPAGLVGTLAVIFLILVSVYKSPKQLTNERVVHLALLFTLALPFFLPKMHDRYFFPAELFAILFAFYFPRFALLPVVIVGVSFFSYFPYLFDREIIPLSTLAFVLLITIGVMVESQKRKILSFLRNELTYQSDEF